MEKSNGLAAGGRLKLPGGVHAAALERQQHVRLQVELEHAGGVHRRGERDRRRVAADVTSLKAPLLAVVTREMPLEYRVARMPRVGRHERDQAERYLADQPLVVAGEVGVEPGHRGREAELPVRRKSRNSTGISWARENVWDRLSRRLSVLNAYWSSWVRSSASCSAPVSPPVSLAAVAVSWAGGCQ